ncbi:PGPGW domain-containing protein [Herbiconiux liangxiaofengii]|uniref:PGPGW domain-containing protein n=1 Tax=Herbiconiux liangxiaofengii TaxID=3342795 RepID=UPI0035B7CBCD
MDAESTAASGSTSSRGSTGPVRAAAGKARAVIRRDPRVDRVYRTGVGIVGGGTVALGIVMIPLPGPGALVAVGGLALLGTEFEGAKKASTKANAAVKKGYAKAKDVRAARRAKKDAAASPR